MARLYVDEHFPHEVVRLLRAQGHDVLTPQEAGQANQAIPDDLVLQFASSLGRAIVTLNRHDFVRLHNQSSDHWGIVICTYRRDPAQLAERLHAALQGCDLRGELLRVYRPA